MKTAHGFTRPRRSRASQTQRARLLAAFAQSGLSAAALARQHECRYPTFCGWRARQAQARPAPGFVELELAAPLPARAELVLALGPHARLRITDAGQIALAARRLPALRPPTPG